MKRKSSWIFIFMLILITALSVVVLYFNALEEQKYLLSISHESGIYDKSIDMTVELRTPGIIYYTVNGEKLRPGETDVPGQMILLPGDLLHLELGEDTAFYSLQFFCVFDDGTVSGIYERNFILDEKGEDRFTTTYVISVVGDEEQLFGYDEGLFVRGRKFDEYIESQSEVDFLAPYIPANYFSNAEVPVHAFVFLQDGTQIISQKCGLKIYGNTTRVKNQKSFRLIARHNYSEANEFNYAFFPKLVSEEGKCAIDAFQRLSLHNSGNDNGYAFIRTELVGELARMSGFPDVLVSESATVYVNGRYQGVYWLVNTFDDRYFKEKYGDYKGEMAVCEGTLGSLPVEKAETENERQLCEDYNSFCEWAQTVDMQEDSNWDYACKVLDIENFARYMAIEYYVGNIDWPNNNVKVYRYQNAPGENYREGSVFDGRYRYLLFDTDFGMGFKSMGWFGLEEANWSLEILCKYSEDAALFQALIQREEFRSMFMNSIMNLMCGSFSAQTVAEVLEEYNGKRFQELEYMVEERGLLMDSLWGFDENNIEYIKQDMDAIISFIENRPLTVMQEMQAIWNCGEKIELSIASCSDSGVYIDGMKAAEGDYKGFCLENVPVEVELERKPGITVVGYYVNSGFIQGEKIRFLPREYLEGGNYISIEPIFEEEPVESLVISAYHIRGSEDYVVLQNNGRTSLLLSDYALSDSEGEWSQGRLPDVRLEPGEEYVVYGKKYSGEMADKGIRVPFSWNEEEPILLFSVLEGIVDCKNMELK